MPEVPSAPIAEAVHAILPYAGPARAASDEARKLALELARPAQAKSTELLEGLGILVPVTSIIGWVLDTYVPVMPDHIVIASSTVLVVLFSFALSRLRDLRWRGGLVAAAKAQQ